MIDIIESDEVFEIEVKQQKLTQEYTIDDFTQSQAHGLFWDSEIREKVFELPKCKNDTKKYDICSEENKFNSASQAISIEKCRKNIIDNSPPLQSLIDQITDSEILSHILEIQTRLQNLHKKRMYL